LLALTPNEDIHSRVTYSVLIHKLPPDDLTDFVHAELDRAGLPHSVLTPDASPSSPAPPRASCASCATSASVLCSKPFETAPRPSTSRRSTTSCSSAIGVSKETNTPEPSRHHHQHHHEHRTHIAPATHPRSGDARLRGRSCRIRSPLCDRDGRAHHAITIIRPHPSYALDTSPDPSCRNATTRADTLYDPSPATPPNSYDDNLEIDYDVSLAVNI